jgi:cysteine desulfurase/selenocysteine lyase
MDHLRKDFPILSSSPQPFIYFDNAATTQKPESVIEAMSNFYRTDYATVNRSMYARAEKATEKYEAVRAQVASFIGAEPSEIVFTKGATESINMVATAWGMQNIKKGDEIVLSELEHHANLLPWQQIAQKTGAILKFIPITSDGTLALDKLTEIITPKTKLVGIIHVSNALGTHNDLEPIIEAAHKVGARVLVDAAQSIAHQKIKVKKMNPDFLVFSGHKMLGPTGVGVLYIKKAVQPEMPPAQFGGSMVFQATYTDAQWLPAPACYEAGTPPIAEVIGLGAALEYYIKNIDFTALKAHETALTAHTINGLSTLPGIRILGPVEQLKKMGHMVSFTVEGYHPHDIGAYLDANGIAVRTGHYCAQPLAQRLGITGSIRVSFSCYNTIEEVDYFLEVMKKLLI